MSRKTLDSIPDFVKDVCSPEDPEDLFELLEKLGKGAHGVVYKAVHRIKGTISAIKKLEVAPSTLKEILGEIKVLRELNESPFTIKYFGSYYKEGYLWISMEFFDAGSIGDLLTEKKGLSEEQIGAILKQVIPGLIYLHSVNKIHRDIKAGNLLLNSQGEVKLADFGICTSLDQPGSKRQTQVGSPFWMAPEIVDGSGYDQKADVWALGITTLEMAEFEHELFDLNPMTAMFKIVTEDPPTLSGNKWSSTFTDFIAKCLTKEADERPTAKQLLEHPFIVQAESKRGSACLAQLVEEYNKLLDKMGCNASIRGEKTCEAGDTEGIIKVYMPDKTYRTMLVKTSQTTTDVVQILRKRMGIDEPGYSLYRPGPNGEQNIQLLQADKPLLLVKDLPVEKAHFLCKEQPDKASYDRLITLLHKLRDLRVSNTKDLLLSDQKLVEEFVEVLMAPGLSVIETLIKLVPENKRDALVSALIPTFESRNQMVRLLKKVSQREIAGNVEANNLFRGASITGKLLSKYGTMIGGPYLKKTLGSILAENVLSLKDPLELDPTRLKIEKGGKDPFPENLRKLRGTCKMIVIELLKTYDFIPRNLRHICREIQIIVTEYYKQKKLIVPALVLFILLMCPALVSPKTYGICDAAPNAAASRTLILISKTILSLATGVYFGKKEEYMGELNKFIEEYKPFVEDFLDRVLLPVNENETKDNTTVTIANETVIDSLVVIHELLSSKMTAIKFAMGLD